MNKIKFGIVGLGKRGSMILETELVKFKELDIVAVCDLYEDRNEAAAKLCEEKLGKKPFTTTDYKELLAIEDLEAVYVATSWETHVEIAIASMRAGKATAMEVGGAYNLDELYELIRAYEETKSPFMLMENCCFNNDELLATALVRSGKLGKIVHCSGAYAHDLREEVSKGNIDRHYRLRNYKLRNTENYPTHELGPIAKLLNINRGNRMVSLVSVASKGVGLKDYIKDHPELVAKDPTLADCEFRQGDIVHTIITCAGGETILLKLDTTLPRNYSREFTVRGTKGYYSQDNNMVYTDGMEHGWVTVEFIKNYLNNAKAYEDEFLPPIWRNISDEEKNAGHGGMDGIEFRYFIDAYLNKTEMPIDVYDAAAWMCISALAEQSIAQGGMPQAIPDFTSGKWTVREPKDVMKLV